MLFRAVALSLALLVGIGTIVPIATQFAEAGSKQSKKRKKRHWIGVKKYSKRWWQLYRAQERRKKRVAKRRRTLRLRQIRLAKARAVEQNNDNSVSRAASAPRIAKTRKNETASALVLPSGDPAPTGWTAAQASPAELQFRIDNSSGAQVGSAAISVIGPSMADGSANRRNSLGGVSTTSLRRDVIDKMIRENGWVVNDYQKEISGQPVYVVVAQSQSRTGSVQSRMFYFTEVDGRIYSVATNSPVQEQERLAEESEKVINSLKMRVRPSQRAATRQ